MAVAAGPLPWLSFLRIRLLLFVPLVLGSTGAGEAEADHVELTFFLESFPEAKAEAEAGELLQEFEGEAIFQVDWARKSASWRLPDFTRFTRFETAAGLGSISQDKHILEVFMELSNRTRAQKVLPWTSLAHISPSTLPSPATHRSRPLPSRRGPDPCPLPSQWGSALGSTRSDLAGLFSFLPPRDLQREPFCASHPLGVKAAPSAKVYPKYPVEPGDPNALICFMDHFSPPVLNVTWLKNGQVVSEGVEETGILPSADNAFRMFSYLPFVPEKGDFYTCRVEHRGLPEPLTVIWPSEEPTPLPDTAENVICGLGLAIGILGIIVGTVFFFKAMRMTNRNSRNGRSGGL